jgi:hypothetical protein
MAESITLNERQFELQDLHPFGVVLRPYDDKEVPVLDWAGRDLESLVSFVKKRALVLVQNAEAESEEWEHIPAPDALYSARMWHNDGQGSYPVVAWMPALGLRNPTAFAFRDDVVDVQKNERELLNPSELDHYKHGVFTKNRASQQLLEVYRHLGQVSDQVRIQLLDRLGIYLIRLARLDRVAFQPQKSLLDRFLNGFKGSELAVSAIDIQESDMLEKNILKLILFFTQKVTTELARRKKLYIHRWNEHPQTAVFLNNGFVPSSEHSSNGPMAKMLHCRFDAEEISDEAELYRLRLVRDDQNGAPVLQWAIKSFPAF